MSTPIQTGSFAPHGHLDPDTLSAFLEGVLPEPERLASLRHLAGCADCRELVFLAQAADPALTASAITVPTYNQKSTAAPRPQRWSVRSLGFSWVSRSWASTPARRGFSLAALTCTIVAVTIVQLHTHSKQRVETQSTAALTARQSAAPIPPPVTRAGAGNLSPSLSDSPRSTSPHRVRPAFASPADPQRAPETFPSASDSPFVPQPSNRAEPPPMRKALPQAGSAAPVAAAASPERNTSPATSELRDRMSLYQAPAAPAARPPGNSNGTALTLPKSARAAEAPTPAAPPPPTPRAAAAGQPAAPPIAVNETVEVSAAAVLPLSETSVLSNAEIAALPPSAMSPLPGGGLTVASAASGRNRLALDTAGALYASRDAGRHWKLVKPRWSGAIQTLSLTPDGHFQINTNSGSIWTSTDGQHWKNH